MIGVAPSFISRVSNEDVLVRASQIRFSNSIEVCQRQLYNKIQSLPINAFIRQLVCEVDGQPKSWFAHRSRGRPRQRWGVEVYKTMW